MASSDQIIIASDHDRALKSLGAKWDAGWGAWTLPATHMNAQALVDLDLGFPDHRDAFVDSSWSELDDRLFVYQNAAASRLLKAEKGQLLAMSPGLGKTATAIVAADALVKDDRIVVVAPASLLKTWKREILKWSDATEDDIYLMVGKLDFARALESRWIIVSWDKAVRHADVWGDGWPLWILDESILVKNRKSKRFKTFQKLRKQIGRVWLLSGNPASKFNDDLWAQLHLIWPKAFSSYWRFAERYTIVEETPWARQVVASKGRPMEDNKDLVTVVQQEDVLDLPDYLFEVIDCDLTGPQATAYAQMQKDFIAELSSGDELIANHEISKLLYLQQIASTFEGWSGKVETLADIIDSYEPPYLIWTHWKATAEATSVALSGAGVPTAVVTGDTRDKDTLMEDYKRGVYDALVLSLGVGKFGHTFTNTKTMFYVDKSWNADDYFQSLHRVRRIGLEHSPVVVTLRVPGTVDELVEANLDGKLRTISKMTKADLAKLLKGLR